MPEFPTARTDSRSRGKKLSRVGKRVPEMYVVFRFGPQLAILGPTNVIARLKPKKFLCVFDLQHNCPQQISIAFLFA